MKKFDIEVKFGLFAINIYGGKNGYREKEQIFFN